MRPSVPDVRKVRVHTFGLRFNVSGRAVVTVCTSWVSTTVSGSPHFNDFDADVGNMVIYELKAVVRMCNAEQYISTWCLRLLFP
jgi:hypothetical protein